VCKHNLTAHLDLNFKHHQAVCVRRPGSHARPQLPEEDRLVLIQVIHFDQLMDCQINKQLKFFIVIGAILADLLLVCFIDKSAGYFGLGFFMKFHGV
jgi:hypothetical protein